MSNKKGVSLYFFYYLAPSRGQINKRSLFPFFWKKMMQILPTRFLLRKKNKEDPSGKKEKRERSTKSIKI